MKRKGNLDLENHKLSKLQLVLCFSVFILMLIILMIFASSVNRSITLLVFLPLVCVVFAFLMREPISAGSLKTLEISILGFRFRLERSEKQPNDIVHVIPRKERQTTTREANSLHDRGNAEFYKGNYMKAAKLFEKAFEKASYWPARVNQALSLEEAKEYDHALSILQSIKENCRESKYLVQAYINAGTCLIDKSLICLDREIADSLKEIAYENYRMAYAKDGVSILPVYHLWFGALITERQTEALKLAQLIEMHDQYYKLTSEARDYFKKCCKEKNGITTEELVMNWKKMIVTVTVAIVIFASAALSLAGGHVDSPTEVVATSGGILNGNA